MLWAMKAYEHAEVYFNVSYVKLWALWIVISILSVFKLSYFNHDECYLQIIGINVYSCSQNVFVVLSLIYVNCLLKYISAFRLWCCWLIQRKGIQLVKFSCWRPLGDWKNGCLCLARYVNLQLLNTLLLKWWWWVLNVKWYLFSYWRPWTHSYYC